MLDTETDFNDEEIWGIITEREQNLNRREMERLAIEMYMIKQERLKMETAE